MIEDERSNARGESPPDRVPSRAPRSLYRWQALFIPLALAYPVIVYLGLRAVGTQVLGVLVVLMAVVRWYSLREFARGNIVQQWAVPLVCLLLGVLGLLTRREEALLFLPAMVSALMGLAFFHSASGDRLSFVERIAMWRRECEQLPPTAAVYCRRVTLAWGVFMTLNAIGIAALALWAPIAWWSLYSGLISYIAMGLLFGAEYVYRRVHVQPIADREARDLDLL